MSTNLIYYICCRPISNFDKLISNIYVYLTVFIYDILIQCLFTDLMININSTKKQAYKSSEKLESNQLHLIIDEVTIFLLIVYAIPYSTVY